MDPAWWEARARLGEVGRPTDGVFRALERWAAPVIRVLHRPELTGVEHLPDGAFLLVANHSAIGLSEVLALCVCWQQQLGRSRKLTGMAHPFAFSLWPVAPFLRQVGAIPSTYQHAEAALGDGVSVLVFPGGDWESTRPVWQARQVQFNGRKGFLRIARRARVPIVPLGITGSIYSAPILWRSELLAWLAITPRLIGIKRFPLSLLGVIGAGIIVALASGPLGWGWTALLTWLWLASPFPLLPWIPATIRMRFGPPLAPEELFDAALDDEAQLARAYARVETAVQALVSGSEVSASSAPARHP